jgi:hypothetical protein
VLIINFIDTSPVAGRPASNDGGDLDLSRMDVQTVEATGLNAH